MTELFIEVLNCSFAASVAGLFVLIFRQLLRRVPRKFSYLLWVVVLFRALCPFSLESVLSLMPVQSRPIEQEIVYQQVPRITTGVTAADHAANYVLQTVVPTPEIGASVNPMQIILEVLAFLWIFGGIFLLLWSGISYWRLSRKLKTAVRLEANVWESDQIGTALVVGFWRPRIILPNGLSAEEREVILAHERVHIARRDNWIKMLAFLAICVHWFNPFLWLCWRLAQKDMEMSCDEAVLRNMEGDPRKFYSTTLLNLSERQAGIFSPLAFGESNVKSRIRNVLRYRKPIRWIAIAAGIAAVGVCVGLLLNRPAAEQTLSELDAAFDLSQREYSRIQVRNGAAVLAREKKEAFDLEEWLETVRVFPQEIDQDRSEIRPIEYRWTIFWMNDGTEYQASANFYDDFHYVWLDNEVKPSLTYEVANPEELQKRWQEIYTDAVGTAGVTFTQIQNGKILMGTEFVDWKSASQVTQHLLSGEPEGEEVHWDVPEVSEYLKIEIGFDRIYYVYEENGAYWAESAKNADRHQIPGEDYWALMSMGGRRPLHAESGDYSVVLNPLPDAEWDSQTNSLYGSMWIYLRYQDELIAKSLEQLNLQVGDHFLLEDVQIGDLTGEGSVEMALPLSGGGYRLYRTSDGQLQNMGDYSSISPLVRSSVDLEISGACGPENQNQGLKIVLLPGSNVPEDALFHIEATQGTLYVTEDGKRSGKAEGEYPTGTEFEWVPEQFVYGARADIRFDWKESHQGCSGVVVLRCGEDQTWRGDTENLPNEEIISPISVGKLQVGENVAELLLIEGSILKDQPLGGGTYETNYQGEYVLRLSRNSQQLSELVLGTRNFPGSFTIRSADYDGNGQTPEFAVGQWAGSNQKAYDIFSIREDQLIFCGSIMSSEFPEDFSPVFQSENGEIRTTLYDTETGEMENVVWSYEEDRYIQK
ncbi:MAG: M56 family metallopeptidase [Candidatus Merdivicinus sp.]|jgi:beta-lactamase regulating signal transducer with metallopeptidase domain